MTTINELWAQQLPTTPVGRLMSDEADMLVEAAEHDGYWERWENEYEWAQLNPELPVSKVPPRSDADRDMLDHLGWERTLPEPPLEEE